MNNLGMTNSLFHFFFLFSYYFFISLSSHFFLKIFKHQTQDYFNLCINLFEKNFIPTL